MMAHMKRIVAPGSWGIGRKVSKYVSVTSPGPHNAGAIPVAVWMRDQMGLARNMKEIKQILHDRQVVVNGKVCSDPHIGLGVFDIISFPRLEKHYVMLLDKSGRFATSEIDAAAAKVRLSKIRNKTTLPGGKVQLNLLFGANLVADDSYHPKDSIILTLGVDGDARFSIKEHFPYAVGNVAMVVGGQHSGRVARIREVIPVPGSVPNRVSLEDLSTGAVFETIEPYIFMVGRDEPSLGIWGITV
ncbi:MAG: 30S ribosomal protein S4e [Methanocalculus sp.]|nr:30S ribosomal protein S4e [Methanocalculus sp.]MDO9538440.1 30S ribosomal protein S4e [Methanocalculus sp.]